MLRPYQSKAIDSLRDMMRAGISRVVMQLPTGAGKTIIAAAIIRMAREKGKRVLFVVPALSLIDQTVERFEGVGIDDIGVMQATHELTRWGAPVQVCSIQTLSRRTVPEADLVIVDEAHVQFKFLRDWMMDPAWSKIPFVGLSATPWAKGMGTLWGGLMIPVTMQELIDLGHLSRFRVFAPAHPDLSGVRTVAGDYEIKALGEAMDKGALVADIVSTWLARGENRPTICFCVNRAHAKNVADQFEKNGVAAGYMDAFTDRLERTRIVRRFEAGEIKVLCNVGVLTTGFDSDVRCIILARPTKSEMLFVQMVGRGLRPAEGKADCLILDHSDTTIRLGFVSDIHHDALDDGKRKAKNEREKKEPLPKECPRCTFLRPPKVKECPACGFVAQAVSGVEVEKGDLHEITRDRRIKPKDWSMDQKAAFYAELLLHAKLRGYKAGWAYHAYKNRLGVGPHHTLPATPAQMISAETQGWIRHYNIAKAKAREAGNGAARKTG